MRIGLFGKSHQTRCDYYLNRLKDPEHCISDKNNWDTNYGGSSLGYWLNDTSGDAVDIYVDNDNLLHATKYRNICQTHFASHPNKDPQTFYDEYKAYKAFRKHKGLET